MYREEIILQKLVALSQKTQVTNSYKTNYNITKQSDIWMLVLPQWSNYLPPFNLARLSSILLENGYYTRCLDLNIKAYNIIKFHIDELGYDPWDGTWVFKWQGNNYFDELHKYFEKLYEESIEILVKANPKVIGFSVYWTNQIATKWMVEKLRKRLPNTIFICGGPSTQSRLGQLKELFDIVVVGEAEKIILDIMDQVENDTLDRSSFPLYLTQPFKERLNLNIQPIPNYADFDSNEYKVPNGMVTEFSRGCVAKCTFCEETHFWNFRQRGYLSLVDEIEHLNKAFGFDAVWFLDSLINGSLKELEEFAKEVIKRGLKIKFFGFARHDKRMDLNYLKLMAQAGLVAFQYGSESGSNKVLEDMKKRVTKEDMEQNFRDGAIAGVQAVTSWVIGFPTETTKDFVDTMTLIWRNRNTSLANLVASTRFHMNPQNIVSQNPERFGISLYNYDFCWIKKDFTLGKPQLSIRAKAFQLFTEELDLVAKSKIQHMPRPQFKKEGYSIKYNNRKSIKEIEWEEFDYNIINTGNVWMDSCLNEAFSIFRLLWRTRGGFEASIIFDPKIDEIEFGPSLANDLSGKLMFRITDVGEWIYDTDLSFVQKSNPFTALSPNFFFDLSDAQVRARKLAQLDKQFSQQDYDKIVSEVEILNKTVDLSFNIKKTFTGSWAPKKKSLM